MIVIVVALLVACGPMLYFYYRYVRDDRRRAVALHIAHTRTLDGLRTDLYNCAMRGHEARLAMCLQSFAMRKRAAELRSAEFLCLNGVPEDAKLFDIDFLTPRHRTCLLLAARVGSVECCKLLIEHHASVNVEGHSTYI